MKKEEGLLPLKGVRVVEMGVWIAVPAAGAMLCDWGADVIKIEPSSGDPARHAAASIYGFDWDFVSPPFEVDNRGKRSLELDAKDPKGQEIIAKLLETADVFISNLRPGAMKKLGLSPEALREKYPHLVIGQITGYGSSGPEMNTPGYDSGGFWAYSGLAHQFAGETGYPPVLASAVGDHLTGMSLASGLAAALYGREQTGQGCIVETSLLKTGIFAGSANLSVRLSTDVSLPAKSRFTNNAPLVNNYRCSDGKAFWLLCTESDRHWPTLLEAIERLDLKDDGRFSSTPLRSENAEELIKELDQIFATKTRPQWIEIFNSHEVWWAPVHDLDEIIENEQANHIGSFPEMPAESDGDACQTIATPVDFNRVPTRPRGRSPALGRDNDAILKELDLQ